MDGLGWMVGGVPPVTLEATLVMIFSIGVFLMIRTKTQFLIIVILHIILFANTLTKFKAKTFFLPNRCNYLMKIVRGQLNIQC